MKVQIDIKKKNRPIHRLLIFVAEGTEHVLLSRRFAHVSSLQRFQWHIPLRNMTSTAYCTLTMGGGLFFIKDQITSFPIYISLYVPSRCWNIVISFHVFQFKINNEAIMEQMYYESKYNNNNDLVLTTSV